MSFLIYDFSPNSVSTLWGSYGKGKEWCPWGVLPQRRLSTAQARTEFRLRRQCAVDRRSRDFGSFYRVSVHFLEQNVVLRDRCKESDTLWKSWQVQYFVDVAKTLAGVCHSKDCVLRDRRRESAPWMLCFEVEGLDSWEGLHFWNLSLRISLRGQCSISYDLGSWFRGRRSTSETCFHFRGSLVQNARFGAPDLQFSRKSRTKRSFWKSGASVFEEVSHKTLVLEVRIFSFRGSLAQNAPPELQFSRKSCTKRSFWKSGSSVFEEVSHKTLVLEVRIFSFRGSLAEFARLQYLDASGPKLDPNAEILRQRSCRSGPTGSW